MKVVLGIPLCSCVEFLMEVGRFVSIGVDLMLSRRSSKVFPEGVAVVSDVFIVLICLSINPFDFG